MILKEAMAIAATRNGIQLNGIRPKQTPEEKKEKKREWYARTKRSWKLPPDLKTRRGHGELVDVTLIPFEKGSREYLTEYQRRYRAALRDKRDAAAMQ